MAIAPEPAVNYQPAPDVATAEAAPIADQDKPVAAQAEVGVLGDAAQASADGTKASPKYAVRTEATGYNATTGEVDPNTMTAAGQMGQITATDSPLMRRAHEQGMLSAAGRGLQNSSIAAGSAMGAMVDRATPLAQQDAATHFQNMRANLDAANRAAEISTGRETDVSMLQGQLGTDVELANAANAADVAMFNAAEENKLNALRAELETAVNQGNQEAANRIEQQMADINAGIDTRNAELMTQVEMENAAAINEINKTVLQGNQAMDLESMRMQWGRLINADQVAGNMWNSFMDTIGNIVSNPDLTPQRAAEYINVAAQQMEGGFELIDAINNVELPGATAGEGKNAAVEVTPP